MEKLLYFLAVICIFNNGSCQQLKCHSCEGGPQTNCAQVKALGSDESCVGKNAQCYEAYVEYQNGALPLIQRRCWTTPNNSKAIDFCKSFNNPNGKLKKCRTCRTNLCNTHIWEPIRYWYPLKGFTQNPNF